MVLRLITENAFRMRRLVLIISILLCVQVWAANPGKTVSKAQISTVISECRSYEGAELVRLGRFKTAALKGVIRLAAAKDPDARKALSLMKGIRGISVLNFEDCSSTDKNRIAEKLERALLGGEMLMEASDGGDKVQIYGVADEKADILRDFVLYAPSDCSLICIFGSISMDTIAAISSDD